MNWKACQKVIKNEIGGVAAIIINRHRYDKDAAIIRKEI
jgi:hypothetical protein